MSEQTLAALETAIEEHFRGEMSDLASVERRGAVVVNWVVGLTISNLVDVHGDGDAVVGYTNDFYMALGDPNAAVHLAQWVSGEIAEILQPDGDDS